MNGRMKVSVSQKEFITHLTVCNNKRCVKSALALSLIMVATFLVYKPFGLGMNTKLMMIFAGIFVGVQIFAGVIGFFFHKNNEYDRMVVLYRAYYALSIISLLVMGVSDAVTNSSLVLIAGAMMLYAIVPILNENEIKVYSTGIAMSGVVVCFLLHKAGARVMVDSSLIMIMGILAGKYHSDMLRRHEKTLDELKKKSLTAETDPLTGLVNRRGLSRRANTIWPFCTRTGSTVGIIALDIDFFKKYNDKYGHPAGDKCLVKISEAIRQSARRGSDIAARIGGEEFLVFVQDMSKEEIVDLALKIRSSIADLKIQHAYVGVSNYVTVSMGVATVQPKAFNNFHDLYEEADQALYMAKENGRNCIVCDGVIYGRMKNGLGTVISM